jgi:hypothetical protein
VLSSSSESSEGVSTASLRFEEGLNGIEGGSGSGSSSITKGESVVCTCSKCN